MDFFNSPARSQTTTDTRSGRKRAPRGFSFDDSVNSSTTNQSMVPYRPRDSVHRTDDESLVPFHRQDSSLDTRAPVQTNQSMQLWQSTRGRRDTGDKARGKRRQRKREAESKGDRATDDASDPPTRYSYAPTDPYSDPDMRSEAERSLASLEFASAANAKNGLPPPHEQQSPLAERMQTITSSDAGESRSIQVNSKGNNLRMTIGLEGHSVKLPNGQTSQVRSTELKYHLNGKFVEQVDCDTLLAQLNVFQTVHAIHPHISENDKTQMTASLLERAADWYDRHMDGVENKEAAREAASRRSRSTRSLAPQYPARADQALTRSTTQSIRIRPPFAFPSSFQDSLQSSGDRCCCDDGPRCIYCGGPKHPFY
ncbi:uncharacterized protein I303_107319 [Kwoniella dejecticola CBS 10117]|uniref:Uncharacterized protein n=1 Tax=Kwoniella dejecticola CBS 10117 TaxID=1296121 RepID=A0AAJ8KVL7_9TREE